MADNQHGFDFDKEELFSGKLSKDNNELLHLVKLRIVRSFRIREDVVKPLSEFFDIERSELETILMDSLDSSSLIAIHSSFESAKKDCLMDKLHSDLKLCWLCDVLGLISEEESFMIKENLSESILRGNDYKDSLIEGKNKILNLLKDERRYR